MQNHSIRFFFLLLLLLSEPSQAQLRPSLSTTMLGKQLVSGPSVLVVTVRPGNEDFEGVSELRLTAGARLSFLHLTNGESILPDSGPWAPDLAGAARKEEALKSAHLFNGSAYFINFEDSILDTAAHQEQWNLDGLASRISSVIAIVKPHLILFCGRGFLDMDTLQIRLVENAILLASNQCAAGESEYLNRTFAWVTQCIASTFGAPTMQGSYLTKKGRYSKEAMELAKSARLCYRSFSALRDQISVRARSYKILGQKGKAVSGSIVEQLQISSPVLRTVRRTVKSVGENILKGRTASRAGVLAALDSISSYLRYGLERYSELDQRALVLWKGNLDHLQAHEIEKYFEILVSDSIVTERQVFFVAVKIKKPELRDGKNQILFHKTKKDDWVINESLIKTFDLQKDSIFKVLSPEKLAYTNPVALYGLNRLTLEEPFRFSIIHEGKTRSQSVIITKEILLRYSPRHASVVQTPVIPITAKSRLIVDSYNYSRDPVDGELFVKDSLCWSDTIRFTLFQKDEVRRDTFQLHWTDSIAPGTYSVEVRGSNRTVSSFIGQSFSQPLSTSKRLAYISDRSESPLGEYFYALDVDAKKMTWLQLSEATLKNLDIIIVDRATRIDSSVMVKNIEPWIRDGGRFIMLPQFFAANQPSFFKEKIAFRGTFPVKLQLMNASDTFQKYFRMSDVTVRGVLDCPADSSYEGFAATKDGSFILVRKQEGHGSVVISAIDFDVWLGHGDPAGYEFFSKIVFFQ